MPKVEIDMPELPDGWEYTGEYRRAGCADYYIHSMEGSILMGRSEAKHPLVRRRRWRAALGQPYFYVNYACEVVDTEACGGTHDGVLHGLGNHFRTKEEAELAASKFKQMLKEM